MSLFAGQRALRHQFEKLTMADLAGADSIANAKLWIRFGNWGRLSYIDNDLTYDAGGTPTGVEISIAAVHPERDPADPANRLFWLEIAPFRVINYSVGDAAGIAFDPGTRLYVYTTNTTVTGGSPTNPRGALRISAWG